MGPILTRRKFVKSAASSLLGGYLLGASEPLMAAIETFQNTGALPNFPKFKDNLFMAFNPIHNAEGGESDEFTTIENVQRLITEMQVPKGSWVIGIGARSGTASDPYGLPGEMAYLWKVGEPWNQVVTSIKDGSAVPLNVTDPLTVTQVGVLDPETAIKVDLSQADMAGALLWTLQNDETGHQFDLPSGKKLHMGFHNSYSVFDNGLVETIFDAGQNAKTKGNNWSDDSWRKKLSRHIPDFKNDKIWERFVPSFPHGMLHEKCISILKENGWPAAAIVLEGNFRNVVQFHLQQWNRLTPKDPEVKFLQKDGKHFGLFKGKLGREVRPYITAPEAPWRMVGFIWDRDATNASPAMIHWRKAADLFGEDFHIHGFRKDGTAGGHTLFCTQGEGKITANLFPLRLQEGQNAHCFNNDLKFVENSVVWQGKNLEFTVQNDGENYARNVEVGLRVDKDIVKVSRVDLVAPRGKATIRWENAMGLFKKQSRGDLVMDPRGRFLEGNAGTENNVLQVNILS